MPLKALKLRPGVSRENTRYTTENGWFDCDKIRFRMGTPEKIGGWQRISGNTFVGVCRSLWNWVTLSGLNLLGLGTNAKFYIENGGVYNDITPIRATLTLTANPFTSNGTTLVTVAATAHGALVGDYVVLSGASGANAALVTGDFRIVDTPTANSFVIDVGQVVAPAVFGGATVTAMFQLHVGPAEVEPINGWGSGAWGKDAWGIGEGSTVALRIWSQRNFGEDLIFGPRGGGLYYWDASSGLNSRGVELATLPMASDTPIVQNMVFVSDINRFVFAFGCNDYGLTALDPLLIRWSDQESAVNWTPSATTQAGSLRLSSGSEIISVVQARQEILVFTDAAAYSLQYVGPASGVWGAQLLGDNISILSQNAAITASGVAYWMGVDKFYFYDGRIQTLPCELRRHVFSDINPLQTMQVFAGTNEGFNEVWWFYPSKNSMRADRYVVYNYLEKVWYYGSLERTAWLDSGLRDAPLAATYVNNLVAHETGFDSVEGNTPQPITAYIESAEFDIEDGQNFGFVWRVLPDVTFEGSTAVAPSATLTLIPMKGAGSGFNNPRSVAGSSSAPIVRTATVPIEQFTNQVNIRVRGRQMILRMESTGLGVAWQMGTPRIDVRLDGRK